MRSCSACCAGGSRSPRDGGSYTFEPQTRFDKLFAGLVVPRSLWEKPAGRGTEKLTSEDVYGTYAGDEVDCGRLLEQAYVNMVACPEEDSDVFRRRGRSALAAWSR